MYTHGLTKNSTKMYGTVVKQNIFVLFRVVPCDSVAIY